MLQRIDGIKYRRPVRKVGIFQQCSGILRFLLLFKGQDLLHIREVLVYCLGKDRGAGRTSLYGKQQGIAVDLRQNIRNLGFHGLNPGTMRLDLDRAVFRIPIAHQCIQITVQHDNIRF